MLARSRAIYRPSGRAINCATTNPRSGEADSSGGHGFKNPRYLLHQTPDTVAQRSGLIEPEIIA